MKLTRQEKIDLLELIKKGMPIRLVQIGIHPVLIQEPNEDIWHHSKITITEDERLQWLPKAICIVNKTGRELDKNGLLEVLTNE